MPSSPKFAAQAALPRLPAISEISAMSARPALPAVFILSTLSALSLLSLAQSARALDTGWSGHVATHDWGCEVLLCLANPAGPTAVSACVPPIHRLWRELAKGHAFPSCTQATGPHGHSYAQLVNSYYDPCPAGSTALPVMAWAELVAPMSAALATTRSGGTSAFRAAAVDGLYVGLAAEDTWSSGDDARGPKACVADHVEDRVEWSGDSSRTIGRYGTIWVAWPSTSPRAIDVYIDDAFWERVRY